MRTPLERDVKVGIFVSLGVLLLMFSMLFLGSAENFLKQTARYKTYMPNAQGLLRGAKVVVNGIQAGIIEKIALDPDRGAVEVQFSIEKDYQKWIREDSRVQLATQGVLGDKYLTIQAGSLNSPPLDLGATLPFKQQKDIQNFVAEGGALLASLKRISNDLEKLVSVLAKPGQYRGFFADMSDIAQNLTVTTRQINQKLEHLHLKSTSRELEATLKNLRSITQKLDEGQGSAGAFINDPSIYNDLNNLIGGANRNRILRNLIRQSIQKGGNQQSKDESKESQE